MRQTHIHFWKVDPSKEYSNNPFVLEYNSPIVAVSSLTIMAEPLHVAKNKRYKLCCRINICYL